MTYDVIIRDGLWFDGTGNAPRTRSLGIRDGVLATVSARPLDETGCPEVIDAAGKWIMPGFIDVHTHYDAEVLLDPGLRESVRHGVTTVLLGNCSLSTVYANSEDAADLFSRVEAVPARIRVRRSGLAQNVVDRCGIHRRARRAAARAQCQFAAWSFGSADSGVRARSRH